MNFDHTFAVNQKRSTSLVHTTVNTIRQLPNSTYMPKALGTPHRIADISFSMLEEVDFCIMRIADTRREPLTVSSHSKKSSR